MLSHRNSNYCNKKVQNPKRIQYSNKNNVKMAWMKSFLVLLSLILPIFLLEYYVMVPVFVTPVWNRAVATNATLLRKQTICRYAAVLIDRLK